MLLNINPNKHCLTEGWIYLWIKITSVKIYDVRAFLFLKCSYQLVVNVLSEGLVKAPGPAEPAAHFIHRDIFNPRNYR